MEQQGKETGNCILCGSEAASFGSRLIAEGWLCGGCMEKLSPWFRLRQDITAEELRAHLAYRENNKALLPGFCPTVRLWKDPTLYLDDAHRQFAVSDALTKDFPEENPDILEYGQILQCDVRIEEHRTELKQFSKRYNYRFNIWVRILVEHPFFHEMRFCLNRRPLEVKGYHVDASVQGKVVKNRDYQSCVHMAGKMRDALLKAKDAVEYAGEGDTGHEDRAGQTPPGADAPPPS